MRSAFSSISIPLLVVTLLGVAPANARGDTLCRAPATAAPEPATPEQRLGAASNAEADHLISESEGVTILRGSATLRRADQTLSGPRLIYDQNSGQVAAPEGARYRDDQLRLDSSHADFDLDGGQTTLADAEFELATRRGRGNAADVTRDGKRRTVLREARFTTCEPGDDAWYLNARRLELNHAEGIGTAQSVWLSLFGAPVAFFPYLSFPINDERKTGFLMPGISNSSDLGWDLEIPYYLNLAPNYDATLTPRLTQEHGELLQSEMRFLFGTHLGSLRYDYLESDRQNGDRRWFGDWQHAGQLAPGLGINTLWRDLSDNDYLTDFDPVSGGDDIDHLERRADLSYTHPWFSALVRWQDFLTVNDEIAPTAFPYRKLPEINARLLPLQVSGITLGARSQWIRFAHDDRDPVGDRQHHELTLGWPLSTTWGYLHPQLIHRESSYALDPDANPTITDEARFDRSLTGYSIDGGLVFERSLDWGTGLLSQTLEPRLFYLYTPFAVQDEIPRFDTGLQTFSYAQLFRTNRFTGPDRIGDAQQLAASLSTQVRSAETGRELLRASIGRLFYFRDREVTLTGDRDDIGTASYSDIAAEARLQPLPHWSLRAESIYSTARGRMEKGKAGIQYRRDNSHLLNLSLEFDQTDTQTLDGTRERLQQYLISGRWQLHRNWHLLARRYYSLEENHLIDSLAGLEYDTCCWALRLVHTDERETLADNPAETELKQAIYLQLELKGLGGLNDRLRRVVQDRIDGYDMPRY